MENFSFSRKISIADRGIGEDCPLFIIAEAGVAHFGDIEKAALLVDLAADSGADAVKFQVFNADEFISNESSDWKERYRSKELSHKDFIEIQTYCEDKGIIFLATAHDEPSFNFLDRVDVPAFKIGSGEVKNWSFIERVAAKMKPIILSTGMYTMDDIGEALRVIQSTGNRDIVVLHCVTQYPTPPKDVNLRAMEAIRKAYGVLIGYSDHTQDFHFPLAAAALGAKVIEKHITLDFNIPNAQDWKVSCGPENFPSFVRQLREIELGLGTGFKSPSNTELNSLQWARKSLVASVDIKKGEEITPNKLKAKRPGYGISPSDLGEVVGKRARSTIKADTIIRKDLIR